MDHARERVKEAAFGLLYLSPIKDNGYRMSLSNLHDNYMGIGLNSL